MNHRIVVLNVIESAIASLQQNVQKINDLNVFPIPDGDTGTNMLSTLLYAWNSTIAKTFTSTIEFLEEFSQNILFSARGNSGVILSQIIKGLVVGVKDVVNQKISSLIERVAKIFTKIKEYAYSSVENPVEGTMLSIVRVLSEKISNVEALKMSQKELVSENAVTKKILLLSNEALNNTPNQLKVLKDAGVVDSGSYGLVCLIQGIVYALDKKPLKLQQKFLLENNSSSENFAQTSEFEFLKANAFDNIGYCTEFIMTLKKPHKIQDFKIKKKLNKFGDSLVYIRNDDVMKVHIHVKKPGEVLAMMHDLGEFSKVKIENMTSQVNENKVHQQRSIDAIEQNNDKEIFSEKSNNDFDSLGIIVVSNGKGINESFKESGADHIIYGGQTMNPSIGDFKKMIDKMKNKQILLLPNNKNIILTCKKIQEIYGEEKIQVLNTTSMQEGLFALHNISKAMIDFEFYKPEIVDLIKQLPFGSITYATKDSNIENISIKKNQFVLLDGKNIVDSKYDLEELVYELIEKLMKKKKDPEILYIYFNDDVNRINSSLIKRIQKYAKKNFKKTDTKLIYGGQLVYYFLMFVE